MPFAPVGCVFRIGWVRMARIIGDEQRFLVVKAVSDLSEQIVGRP